MKCPICKKEVDLDDPEFPFCSERCRLIDLGNWASEKYVISHPGSDKTGLRATQRRKTEDADIDSRSSGDMPDLHLVRMRRSPFAPGTAGSAAAIVIAMAAAPVCGFALVALRC